LLLNVQRTATLAQARTDIASVWKMLQELRQGVVRELRSERDGVHHTVPPAELTCLLGFGARLFEHESKLPPHAGKPAELNYLGRGSNGPFASLHWDAVVRAGEADLALQFIAENEVTVNRAVAEVYHLMLVDRLQLEFVASYGGFNRFKDDGRSWLNFHDGTSNLAPDQRLAAVEVTEGGPAWMTGGTYMVFLRLALDLETWWKLPRAEQEILVGRDKLSGCPLEGVKDNRVPVPARGCPLTGERLERAEDKEPPETRDPLLAVSHIYRANLTRLPPSDRSNRIFRQGYEFMESPADGQLLFGLNFVSFQRALARFTEILTKDGWLKQVNFAGHAAPKPLVLARVIAGGYYAIPRKSDPSDLFPGMDIFTERSESPRAPSEARGARRPS
jgi:deferrochelatase/peroxidase EfeB